MEGIRGHGIAKSANHGCNQRQMAKPANLCGPAVARLRRRSGITQRELRAQCEAAGWPVARSVLAKVETQSRSVSDIELVALASALGVKIEQLLRIAPRKRRVRRKTQ